MNRAKEHTCCAHSQYHHALASQTSWHVSVEFCAKTSMSNLVVPVLLTLTENGKEF